MEHSIGDTAWFPSRAVVTHNEACSPTLDPFKSVDVCLVVGIPHDGSDTHAWVAGSDQPDR